MLSFVPARGLLRPWLESGWLNLRPATWLQEMGFEMRPFITTTDLYPHLNTNLHCLNMNTCTHVRR